MSTRTLGLAAALLLTVLPLAHAAADDIAVPDGFVLQPLVETDGQIARPKDWFFSSQGTPSGWLWTLSKEDPAKGPYKTGLRIQLLAGVAQGTGKSREQFVQTFIAGKRSTSQVVRTCPASEIGDFHRQCLEVLEPAQPPSAKGQFRVLYSLMWGKELDMVVVSTFGAPPQDWQAVAPIADAMAAFRIIGPRFGQ